MVSAVNDQLTQMQSNTNKVNAEKNKDKVGNTELGQDAFLQLMMQQLKYQDPMNPMDNSEFLAQQAQFTQLSETQKLNTNLSTLSSNMTTSNSLLLAQNQVTQASAMIGQEVKAVDPSDSTKTISGKIDEVKFDEDGIKFVINGTDVPVNNVTSIIKAAGSSTTTGSNS